MKIVVINLVKHKVSRTLISVLLVLIVVLSASFGAAAEIFGENLIAVQADAIPYDKIVIIDAGHGGEDPGAVGVNGVYEKDINLNIAMEIGKMLEEKGYIAVYTRTDDRLLYKEDENIKGIRKISDLKNRVEFVKNYPESVFVSIHTNSFGDGKYSGLQVYYSANNENSLNIANRIQSAVTKELQPENKRNVKDGKDIYLMKNINNPAVLIECGFLTNKEECEKLSEKEYQKQLSFAIVCGIIEYIEEK